MTAHMDLVCVCNEVEKEWGWVGQQEQESPEGGVCVRTHTRQSKKRVEQNATLLVLDKTHKQQTNNTFGSTLGLLSEVVV